jgi:membrane-associated phospholipid phosphatase
MGPLTLDLGNPVMAIERIFKVWCAVFAVTLVGVAIAIRWLDIPVAFIFLTKANRFTELGTGLASAAVLVTGEMVLIVGLAIVRIVRGSLSKFAQALFIACCASLAAFVANDYILKFVFGRRTPSVLHQGIPSSVFHFFEGDQHSSFPSGHMVMATAFAVAMIRLQPRTFPVLAVLLCIGGAALIAGDWHFIGDVIAGVFVGGTAGLMAGELWREYVRHRDPS